MSSFEETPSFRTIKLALTILLALALLPAVGFADHPNAEIIIDERTTEPYILDVIGIDTVWAGHPVRFAIATNEDRQYYAYYDGDRRMVFATRELGTREVERFYPETGYDVPPRGDSLASTRLGWDSHNHIVLAFDSKGHIHASGNMHGNNLTYFRTTKPDDITTLEHVPKMTGELEDRTTYPNFRVSPEGELIFGYRHGASGDGIQIYNIYDTETVSKYNFVNNYILTDWTFNVTTPHARGYFAGNYVMGVKLDDQASLVNYPGGNASEAKHKVTKPFPVRAVTTLTAPEALEVVMATAGAWQRDSHDENVIREVINYRKREIDHEPEPHQLPDSWTLGPIDHQDDVGGSPDLKSLTVPASIDANRNGLPDWWEQSRGLDVDDPDIARIDSNGNGYTNIEDYINDLDAVRTTHRMVNEYYESTE